MKTGVTDQTVIAIARAKRCSFERNGVRCKAIAPRRRDFCFFHDPLRESERTAARRAGGIARTRKPVIPETTPVRKLEAVSDVVELLGETINQVRRGELDLRISNSVGYLSAILLSAIEKNSLEERLTALEASIAERRPTLPAVFDDENVFEFIDQAGGNAE